MTKDETSSLRAMQYYRVCECQKSTAAHTTSLPCVLLPLLGLLVLLILLSILLAILSSISFSVVLSILLPFLLLLC